MVASLKAPRTCNEKLVQLYEQLSSRKCFYSERPQQKTVGMKLIKHNFHKERKLIENCFMLNSYYVSIIEINAKRNN